MDDSSRDILTTLPVEASSAAGAIFHVIFVALFAHIYSSWDFISDIECGVLLAGSTFS